MRVFENRASAILCRFLKSNPVEYPFLLPANVCSVVPLSFLKAGVPFEFVDIDESHAMNRPSCMEKIHSGHYGGVLFVHAYGREFDNEDFYKEIRNSNKKIYIIDDRCLCIPRVSDYRHPDADLELYSTGYAKYVELSYGGWGIIREGLNYIPYSWEYDEAVLQSQTAELKSCLASGQRYGWGDVAWLDNSEFGDGTTYLEKVERHLAKVGENKERINSLYRENLPQEIQWGEGYDSWRFMLEVEQREDLLKAIFDAGLFAGTNFPSVAWLFSGVHLQRSESESARILNLFNDFRVDEDFALKTCKIINLYYGR